VAVFGLAGVEWSGVCTTLVVCNEL
jgi:hypothetical protein